MSEPALLNRESRCEHEFTAGLCPYRGCSNAEPLRGGSSSASSNGRVSKDAEPLRHRRCSAKYLTLSSPPPPVETPRSESQADFVKFCVRHAEIRKLRAWACSRRWLSHG